jgi:hypothetical protein
MTSSEWISCPLSLILNRLILIKQGIFQIEGLENLVNLTEIWLNENEINQIAGLEN